MEARRTIDLNSDVGESFGRYKLGLDEELLPLITSANIACGFHAGDPAVMRKTVSMAGACGTAVGAHPGLPDLIGFGRRRMEASLEEIQGYVAYQTGALQAFTALEGLSLQHVKPHGALYNMAAQDMRIVDAIAEVIAGLDKRIILLTLAGPSREELEAVGKKHGIRISFEFFADRAYNPDGTLVSRSEPGAVIEDPREVADRILQMVEQGSVTARDGTNVALGADTVCVHGDNPSALALVKQIREVLQTAGVGIAPMGTFL